jgi:glutaredoxin
MVEVYGADWCRDTQRMRRHLDNLGITYQYLDVEQDQQASAWVKQQKSFYPIEIFV